MNVDDYMARAPTFAVYDGFCKTKSVMDQHSRILVSVSGGSDSDDMVDVVEHLKPGSGCKVDYVWFNTGIEMDATKAHIRYLKGRYGIEIHEESGKKKVAAAVRSVGYPFYSKQFSEYIERLQKHNFKWEDKPFDVLYAEYPQCKAALRWWCNNWKAEPHRPLQTEIASATYLKEFMVRNPPTFSISKKCCDLAKKSAGDLARKKYAAGIQFIGVRKAEGGARSTNYKSCMSDGRHGLQHFPLFWWKSEDKALFEKCYGICHSEAYTLYGCRRTGCAGCPFAGRFEDELLMLNQFEPKLGNAVSHIFEPSYEYTRAYREFKREVTRLGCC